MRKEPLALTALILAAASLAAEPLPARLEGAWRISRILPTANTACWTREQAQPLVGSALLYRDDSLRWRGGSVPLNDITTRTLTAAKFREETAGSGRAASFAQLGIHSPALLEVDLQHEDMDITGATTEVPGDSVLLAAPNRIIIQACGVFFEATRTATSAPTALFR